MKPGVFLEVPLAPAGATEKIAELFMEMPEVSFMRDIAPALFEEHKYQELCEKSCIEAAAEVERALDIARTYGHTLKCVPQFQPGPFGSLCVSDMIYKRENPPFAHFIRLTMEERSKE